LPTDKVQILDQHLDLVADEKIIKFGVVGLNILDAQFADRCLVMALELGQ
jgi:hypothetical protein